MEINSMKNMIVLKNFPSNIVEEAFVVLKENVKIHKVEMVDKKGSKEKEKKQMSKQDSIVKEAEMVVTEYLNDINSLKNNRKYERILKKYNNLKKVFAITIISFGAIMLFQNFMV